MSPDKEWLQSLKRGDEVALVHHKHLVKVERSTPTQVVVLLRGKELRYRRKDGRAVGGRWSDSILPATSEIRREIRHHQLVEWSRWTAATEIQALSPEAIGQVRALVNQLKKESAA